MKNKKLIKYLQGFDPETEVAIIAVDIEERKKYDVVTGVITDAPIPAMIISLVKERDFDEEERLAAEESEREAETMYPDWKEKIMQTFLGSWRK